MHQWLAHQLGSLPQSARAVAGYIRHGHEVDVEPLLKSLIADGVAVALPVVDEDAMRFAAWDGRNVREGAFGILEPVGRADIEVSSLAVVLVPALACDESGTRLGRGGGYYDRALAAADPTAIKIGVVDDASLLPRGSIPREPHDILMDAIVTPSRLVRPSAGPAA